jgi:aminoglycoside phosphotransferase (APT) family kinase protein
MPTAEQLKRRPTPDALQHLLDEIAPGGRITSIKRLRGGISCGMHGVNIAEASGTKMRVVVRRYDDDRSKRGPLVAREEFQTLAALEMAGIPAPRPIWLDATGYVFGVPTIVESWLPGSANLAPGNISAYIDRLAEALANLHQAHFNPSGKAHLKKKSDELAGDVKKETFITKCLEHPHGEQILTTLHESFPPMNTPTLIHNDFWPGNTVWSRGKFVGITDWEYPVLSQPDFDIAYCRMDLTFIFGSTAADRFRSHYERVTGAHLDAPHFWDLLVATQELPDPADHYLPGYHDLGRTDITRTESRRRYEQFISQALASSP